MDEIKYFDVECASDSTYNLNALERIVAPPILEAIPLKESKITFAKHYGQLRLIVDSSNAELDWETIQDELLDEHLVTLIPVGLDGLVPVLPEPVVSPIAIPLELTQVVVTPTSTISTKKVHVLRFHSPNVRRSRLFRGFIAA